MPSLADVFANVDDLLALPAEELAGVIVEITRRREHITIITIVNDCMRQPGGGANGFPPAQRLAVLRAVAEAINWLTTQGLLIHDPEQAADYRLFTRRAANLTTRQDVAAFRQGQLLPRDLIHPALAERAWPIFARGDYDTAVFQAFKEVEVAVRAAGEYRDEDRGTDLMRRAFGDRGPLTNQAIPAAERQAMGDLFAGAMGHGRNPLAHRDVEHEPKAAAQLIIFASYLLDLAEKRRLAAVAERAA